MATGVLLAASRSGTTRPGITKLGVDSSTERVSSTDDRRKALSPLYTAVSLCSPAARALVTHVAAPARSGCAEQPGSNVSPSRNSTTPPATATLGAAVCADTVAVKVTRSSTTGAVLDEPSDIDGDTQVRPTLRRARIPRDMLAQASQRGAQVARVPGVDDPEWMRAVDGGRRGDETGRPGSHDGRRDHAAGRRADQGAFAAVPGDEIGGVRSCPPRRKSCSVQGDRDFRSSGSRANAGRAFQSRAWCLSRIGRPSGEGSDAGEECECRQGSGDDQPSASSANGGRHVVRRALALPPLDGRRSQVDDAEERPLPEVRTQRRTTPWACHGTISAHLWAGTRVFTLSQTLLWLTHTTDAAPINRRCAGRTTVATILPGEVARVATDDGSERRAPRSLPAVVRRWLGRRLDVTPRSGGGRNSGFRSRPGRRVAQLGCRHRWPAPCVRTPASAPRCRRRGSDRPRGSSPFRPAFVVNRNLKGRCHYGKLRTKS